MKSTKQKIHKEDESMKTIILAVFVSLMTGLSGYVPVYNMGTLIGYTPITNGMVVKFYGKFPEQKSEVNFFCNAYYKNEGSPKGTDISEMMEEPFEWWNNTNEKITSVFTMSGGVAGFLTKYPKFGASIYIGGGTKEETIQYKSTASGMYFYKEGDIKTIFDAGFDLIYKKNAFTASLGFSTQTTINIAIGLYL